MCPFNVMPSKSSKLKEICVLLQKENILFFYRELPDNYYRYRYDVIVKKYSVPRDFPTGIGVEPIMKTYGFTRISDALEWECIEVPIWGGIVLRIKGHDHGSNTQGFVTDGSLEISDIRRIEVMRNADCPPSLSIAGYLDVDDTLQKLVVHK